VIVAASMVLRRYQYGLSAVGLAKSFEWFALSNQKVG